MASAFPHDGGHAFPTMTDGGFAKSGMSLRDWLAGQAILTAAMATGNVGNSKLDFGAGELAQRAYAIADAMLAERRK